MELKVDRRNSLEEFRIHQLLFSFSSVSLVLMLEVYAYRDSCRIPVEATRRSGRIEKQPPKNYTLEIE
jgi:hypothetical protein